MYTCILLFLLPQVLTPRFCAILLTSHCTTFHERNVQLWIWPGKPGRLKTQERSGNSSDMIGIVWNGDTSCDM